MSKTINVMLLEDNVEYSEVIQLALNDIPDMKLVGHFGTAEIALRTLQNGSVKMTLPELILLDLRLPGMDGLDAIPALFMCVPDTKIIVLTQSTQEADVLQAISLGASGYLLKSATLEQLTEGIRTVIQGGASLDAGIAKFILNSLQSRLPNGEVNSFLSEREMEVLTLLAEGYLKKEIAKRLDIGYTTVDTHVSRLYLKLNVKNAPSAVNQAHRLGILRRE